MPDVYASLKAFLSKGTFNLHKMGSKTMYPLSVALQALILLP